MVHRATRTRDQAQLEGFTIVTFGAAGPLRSTPKTTLALAIKSARLEYGFYRIDPSELNRVYDVTPATGGATGTAAYQATAQPDPDATRETPVLEAEIEALRARLATMRDFSAQVNSTATVVQPFRKLAEIETPTGLAVVAQGVKVHSNGTLPSLQKGRDDLDGVQVGAERGGRTVNRAEVAFIALVRDIKATLEVRDAILANREDLADLSEELNKLRNGVHARLDEIREDGLYATEIDTIRADYDNELLDATPETPALKAEIDDLCAQLALMRDQLDEKAQRDSWQKQPESSQGLLADQRPRRGLFSFLKAG